MTRWGLAVAVTLSTLAPAGEPSAVALQASLEAYYRGERLAMVPFLGAGVATAATGAGLFIGADDLRRGAAWPLLTVGVLEHVAGVALSARSMPHLQELTVLQQENPAAFLTQERAHLHRITHLFQPALLVAEAVVTVAGGAMAGIGAYANQRTVEGIGFGLGLQGLVLFLLDWAVLDRAAAYEAALTAQ